MGLLDAFAALVRAGYPEETARKIASGELPMDTASRMARAADQGFNPEEVFYHGTKADFNEFAPSDFGNVGPGVYISSNPEVASNYASPSAYVPPEGAQVMPLLTRGETINLKDYFSANPDTLLSQMADKNQEMREAGITAIREAAGAPDRAVFDSRDIRSYFSAAFDPDYSGPNILGLSEGSGGGPSLLGAAANTAVGAANAMADKQEGGYEGLTDKMVDALTDAMGGTEDDREVAEYISMGMDFLPFIGAAKGISETYDAYRNDDALGVGLGLLGAAAGLFPAGRGLFNSAMGITEKAPPVTRDTGLLQRVGDVDEVNAMTLDVEPGVTLLPSQRISAADLEGRGFVSGMSDTSRGDLSRIVMVNGQPVDVVRFGGQDYMRQPYNAERGILWASDKDVVSGLVNAGKSTMDLPGVSRSPLYIPYGMAGASTDFATMTADVMVPVARQNMTKAQKRSLDKRIREGAGKKQNEMKPQPDWPGIDSPKSAEWLASAGGDRKAVTKAIDEFRDEAGISLSQARAAIVDASQMSPRVGNLRQAGVMDLTLAPQAGRHPSYNTDIMGQYLGELGGNINLLDDLNPLIRSSRQPFVDEMLRRGHDLSAFTRPSPVGKAMQAGLIGQFDQAALDALIKKGAITP